MPEITIRTVTGYLSVSEEEKGDTTLVPKVGITNVSKVVSKYAGATENGFLMSDREEKASGRFFDDIMPHLKAVVAATKGETPNDIANSVDFVIKAFELDGNSFEDKNYSALANACQEALREFCADAQKAAEAEDKSAQAFLKDHFSKIADKQNNNSYFIKNSTFSTMNNPPAQHAFRSGIEELYSHNRINETRCKAEEALDIFNSKP